MSAAKRTSSAKGLTGVILGAMSKSKRYRAVDLFAGAGGLSLSAQACGADVVFAVENDKHAAATYRQNFCSSEAHNAPRFTTRVFSTLTHGGLQVNTLEEKLSVTSCWAVPRAKASQHIA